MPKGTRTKKSVRLYLVLDSSGSMTSCVEATIKGFNEYISTLAKDGNEYTVSLITFNSNVEVVYQDLPITDVKKLTTKNYQPNGATALYDGLGKAFELATKYRTARKPYGTEKFLLVVLTDGWENASQQYTQKDIFGKIARRQAAKNWTVVCLGADVDAWALGQVLGLHQGNVLTYSKGQTVQTFRSVATASGAYSGASYNSTENFFGNQASSSTAAPSITLHNIDLTSLTSTATTTPTIAQNQP